MVTLVIVKNPFSPQDGREVKYIEAKGTLAELLEEYKMPGVDLQATVNGYSIEDKEINDEDFIVIYPVIEKGGKGGKGILGIVAAIALSVVSFGIASGGWLAGIGIKAGTFAAYAAATAVMFLGSSLMGRMMGQKTDLGSFDSQNEPTYSWGGVQTMQGQNNAVSLTYGKVKSGGQTIGKFVSSENDEEYLNWLIACGEGELTITDIKLNDNPIDNFAGVSYEVRTGTNDQEVIPNFNDTYFTKNLSYHMTAVDTWYTDTAQGTATEGLVFKIELPSGLFHGTNEGKQTTNEVDVEMQYKLSSSETWLNLATDTISGKSTKAIRREYRVDNITAGEYDVRARVTRFKYSNSSRDVFDVYWTGITSIVYDDFTYPCQALIGIRAKATDQLNGTPSLTFMKERASVWVYNPHADAYQQKDANNPAWACYDYVHQARQLKNTNTNQYEIEVRGAAKELMRYDDFAEWADWCEEKEYFVNIEVNTVGEVLEGANQKLAPIGHGLVVRFGTRYGCIYDHVQTPVQMFGMGNIISGTFSEEFLKVSDRANCVEITFNNKDAGYERDVLTIYSDTYDTDGYSKTAQMTFDGIVDYEQAYREGMYQLYSNKYLLRTVSFECGIDAIACTVGDVVMVSHDVPKWANSGRIESINGATWILPVQLEDLTQSYRVQWRTVKDNLYTRACDIVSSADGWTTITVQGTIPDDDPPQAGDVFDLAIANIGSKPFVVKSITRAQDFTRSISCVEYNENIYNEGYDIPVIDYSQWYGEPKNVTGLVATLTQTKDAYGNDIGKLNCSWNVPDTGGTFTVLLSTDGGETWVIGKSNIQEPFCELDVLPNTTYWVKVITVLGVNQSTGTEAGPIYPSGDGYLPTVTNLTGNTVYRGVKNGEQRYEIRLVWTPPLLSNYLGCDIYYKTNNEQIKNISMASGVSVSQMGYQNDWKYAGSGYADFTLSDVTTGDIYRFAVVTKDSLGNSNSIDLSPTVNVAVSAKTETPNTPNGFGIVFGTECVAKWNEVVNADISFYEIRSDVNCGVEDNHLLARTAGTSTIITLTNRSGTLYLFAKSTLGKYSAPMRLMYSKEAPPKADKPVLSANLGSINIVASAIPQGCSGMNIYIDGDGITTVHTENNTYTHSVEAGIYDVSIAYTDYFGEGEHSTSARIVIKKTIDAKLLEDEAINIAKVDATIKAALEDAVESAQDLITVHSDMAQIENDLAIVQAQGEGTHTMVEQTDGRITEVITNLNKGANNTTYASITQLNRTVEGLQSTVEELVVTGEGDTTEIAVLKSEIQQTKADLTSTVSMLNSSPTAEGQYSSITQLKQTSDGISATVTANKSTETSHYNANVAAINAQADRITTVITNLNDDELAAENYSAIAQMQDNIELKVAKDGVVSALNLTPETARIKGKLITLNGDTQVTGYFWANAVQAHSITADKLDVQGGLSAITADVGSLTGGTITGTTLIGSTIKNANNTFSVSANGAIKGATLTAATINSGTINADMIYSAGYQVKASVLVNGTVSGKSGTIPLPSGYTEAQCLWAVYPTKTVVETVHGSIPSWANDGYNFDVVGRTVRCCYVHSTSESSTVYVTTYYQCNYRIIGIK